MESGSTNVDEHVSEGAEQQPAYLPAVMTLLIGVAVTIIARSWVNHDVETQSALHFERYGERFENELNRRVNQTRYGLMGARDLFLGSEEVTRIEFRDYLASHDLAQEFPGAFGFGMLSVVERENFDTFEEAQREIGAPEYRVDRTGRLSPGYIVKYVEPLPDTESYLGADLGVEPATREAIERSLLTGSPTVSTTCKIQDGERLHTGFFLFLPVITENDTTASKERLQGVLFAPIIIDRLFTDIAEVTEHMMRFSIHEQFDGQRALSIFDFDDHDHTVTKLRPEEAGRGAFSLVKTVEQHGTIWHLNIRSTELFDTTYSYNLPLWTVVAGITVSLLLAAIVALVARYRAREQLQRVAQRLAAVQVAAQIAHQENLERELTRQTRELEEVQARLIRQERVAVLGKLVATVSHEIRNPLGSIRASLYTLRRRLGDVPEGLQAPLDRAERNIVRCDRIIEELLDYTRDRKLELAATDIGPWMDLRMAEFDFPPEVSVQYERNCDCLLTIDANNVWRCLTNIWQNACEAMLDSEGDYHRDGRAILELHVLEVDSRIEIRTRDNGRGMSPADFDRAMEPLFTTKNFGTGLGLSIVKEIMEAHGGGLEITSELNVGTEVVLWLPRDGETSTLAREDGALDTVGKDKRKPGRRPPSKPVV